MFGLHLPHPPRRTPPPDEPWTVNSVSLRLACPGDYPTPLPAPPPKRRERRGLRLIKQVEHEQRED